MSDQIDPDIQALQDRHREEQESQRRMRKRQAELRRVLVAVWEFNAARLAYEKRLDVNRQPLQAALADAAIALRKEAIINRVCGLEEALKSELPDKSPAATILTSKFWKWANHNTRDLLIDFLSDLETIPAEDQADVMRCIACWGEVVPSISAAFELIALPAEYQFLNRVNMTGAQYRDFLLLGERLDTIRDNYPDLRPPFAVIPPAAIPDFTALLDDLRAFAMANRFSPDLPRAVASRTKSYDAMRKELERLCTVTCANPRECLAWTTDAIACLKEAMRLLGDQKDALDRAGWDALSVEITQLAVAARNHAIALKADTDTLTALDCGQEDPLINMPAATAAILLTRLKDWCKVQLSISPTHCPSCNALLKRPKYFGHLRCTNCARVIPPSEDPECPVVYGDIRSNLEANPDYLAVWENQPSRTDDEKQNLARIRYFACQHFRHDEFNQKTIEQLNNFLTMKCGSNTYSIPLKDVADLLEAQMTGRKADGQPSAARKKNRRQRGRPKDTDPKKDKKIFEAWQSRQYKTYDDLAQELRISVLEVKQAIDRHRKRMQNR